MHIRNKNCKHCNGTGKIEGHGAFGEPETYDCGCGIDIYTKEDIKYYKKILKKLKHDLKKQRLKK